MGLSIFQRGKASRVAFRTHSTQWKFCSGGCLQICGLIMVTPIETMLPSTIILKKKYMEKGYVSISKVCYVRSYCIFQKHEKSEKGVQTWKGFGIMGTREKKITPVNKMCINTVLYFRFNISNHCLRCEIKMHNPCLVYKNSSIQVYIFFKCMVAAWPNYA